MRENMEKTQFLSNLKKEIEHRKMIATFFDTTFKELLKKWDGKVMNKRFKDALGDELKKVSELLYAKFKEQNILNQYSNYNGRPAFECIIVCHIAPMNYVDNEELYTKVVCKYDDNFNPRIDAEATLDEECVKKWYENFVSETHVEELIIDQYDEYKKIADSMDSAVTAYNNLPYKFRENMDKNYTHIYKPIKKNNLS